MIILATSVNYIHQETQQSSHHLAKRYGFIYCILIPIPIEISERNYIKPCLMLIYWHMLLCNFYSIPLAATTDRDFKLELMNVWVVQPIYWSVYNMADSICQLSSIEKGNSEIIHNSITLRYCPRLCSTCRVWCLYPCRLCRVPGCMYKTRNWKICVNAYNGID